LNLKDLEPLAEPIDFGTLLARMPPRLQRYLQEAFEEGGMLPPKTLGAFVDSILELQPELSQRLARFSDRRTEMLASLTPTGRANLAVQKETLTIALELAGLKTEEILTWSPTENT